MPLQALWPKLVRTQTELSAWAVHSRVLGDLAHELSDGGVWEH